MVEPQILNSTVHHSGVFSIQMYTRKSAAFRNALKFNRPISQFLMCPDTRLYVQAAQGSGQIWPGLCELFPGCKSRGLQGHAADHSGVASAIEVRQGTGRSFGHVRSDPHGVAAILWPLPWVGDVDGLETCERLSGALADAQIQKSRPTQSPGVASPRAIGATVPARLCPLEIGICSDDRMMGAG